ncbi:MAG: ABC transporter permease [Candidatus Accumulibacter sp.]|jgi:ABC-type nitrate/sulfonate/bicarbonate transport system permease component|nr:ABC transporter permease [Accumulibacter sp.]
MFARIRALLTPFLALLFWQALADSGWVSAYLLPAPLTVLDTFFRLYASGKLTLHVHSSLFRVFWGFTASCLIAFLLALLVCRFRPLEELLTAPLALLRMIPPLAMVPLLILWLGIGHATQITIIVLASFFPIFLNSCAGLRRVTAAQRELANSLHLGWRRYYRYVLLPAATPSIVTGVRLAFGYSWRALIGAELIAASSGLGYLIIDAQGMQRTDEVIVGILTIGLIGWLLDQLFSWAVVRTLGRRFAELRA